MERDRNDPPTGPNLVAGFRLATHTIEPLRNRIAGRDGAATVEPKAMDVLVSLARHAPSVAPKDALIQEVWGHVAVGDEVLTNAIWQVRNALGDRASDPRYIETIRGRGYRLIPKVEHFPITPTTAVGTAPLEVRAQTASPGRDHIQRGLVRLLLGLIAFTVLVVGVRLSVKHASSESASRSEAEALLVRALRLIDQNGDRKRARRHLAQAVALDPTSARAHAAYSDTFPIPQAGSPPAAGAKAREAARRAITLDPELTAGHLAWARVRGAIDWQWDKAAAALYRAQELSPDDGEVLGQLAWLHTLTGRCRQAETAIDQARAQAPFFDVTLERRALKVYFFCHRFDRAVEVAPQLANKPQTLARVHVLHATSHLLLGHPEAAHRVLRSASPLDSSRGDLAFTWARLGAVDRARGILDRIVPTRAPYQAALAHLGLGDIEAAWAALEDAVTRRDPEVTRLAVDPRLVMLRTDPRFALLRARIGL